VVLILGTYKY